MIRADARRYGAALTAAGRAALQRWLEAART